MQMSVSEILTKKEKREIIKAMGVKEAIDALARILNLSEEEKEQLPKKYKK